MIFNNSGTNKKIVPLPSKKYVPNGRLVHNNKPRKYIPRKKVEEIAKKKYVKNGGALTFLDFQINFTLGKDQAQRQIKYLHMKKFLFTADDLKKQGIVFKGRKRTRPQKYYLTEMKAKIIEDNKNNVQNDTTGIGLLDNQKIQYLQDQLFSISKVILYIHKFQIKIRIDKKHYEEIKDAQPAPHNSGAKTITQWIGNSKGGSMKLNFTLYPNGTVMIYLKCSDNPFRLKFEDDVSAIMTFLGRMEERLHNLLSDRRGIIVPPVNKWILKNCDVNKDIEIDSVTQLTLTDMQMPLVEKALRAYVKVIGDKAYLRVEKYLTPNKPIEEALENIRTTVDLDKDFFEKE